MNPLLLRGGFGFSRDSKSLFGIHVSRYRRLLGTLLISFLAGTVRSDTTNCCVTEIQFTAAKGEKNLKIEAYTDSGSAAKNNGFPMNPPPKPTTLSGFSAKKVIVRISEGNDKTPTPISTHEFTCDNLKVGTEIYEDSPVDTGAGATMTHRLLYVVTSFTIANPCEAASPEIPDGITGFVMETNNTQWRDPENPALTQPGSGALVKFSVPTNSLSASGCDDACWVQGVTTTIELLKSGSKKWKTISAVDWHNDNLTFNNTTNWFCYGPSYVTNGNLVLGDGPHLVHSAEYCFSGKKYKLEAGDLIRRRSAHVTALVCHQPPPETVLATFIWSVTTLYKFDPNDLNSGGSTVATQPIYINLSSGSKKLKDIPDSSFAKVFDPGAFNKYLQKKKQDKENCK